MDPDFASVAAELAHQDERFYPTQSQSFKPHHPHRDQYNDSYRQRDYAPVSLDDRRLDKLYSRQQRVMDNDDVPSPSPTFRFQPASVQPNRAYYDPPSIPAAAHHPSFQHQPAFHHLSQQPYSQQSPQVPPEPRQRQTQQQSRLPASQNPTRFDPPLQPQPFRGHHSYHPRDHDHHLLHELRGRQRVNEEEDVWEEDQPMRGQPEERRNEQSGDEFDEEFGDGSELVDVEARPATLPRVRPVPPPPPPPVASSHQQPPVNSRPRQQQPQQQQQQVQRTGSKGRRLIPVSSLPDRYRALFKFGVFNAVQSRCFDTAVKTDENLVVSSPTGSGKTVLFELTIIRLLEFGNDGKAVYIAPTKALCAERAKDWDTKFAAIGVRCAQLTGDTEWTAAGFKDIDDARIIVTTPEKWDSITRWKSQKQESRLLSNLALFLIDEVHILHEKRGATLEVVVSRMKSLGTRIRFVALSATAPNIADVGTWLRPNDGSSESSTAGSELERLGSAKVFTFDDSYRPCLLKRVIVPVLKKGGNDWVWLKSLEFRVFDLLIAHGENAPSLVFCPTRKGAVSCAEQLAKQYREGVDKRAKLPWSNTRQLGGTFADKALQLLSSVGIAFHHGGMSYEDRQLVEKSFLSGSIKVICSTSTLAVGVNLPAHTVVVLGTKQFTGSRTEEYSSIDITQMIGRAGRPQFDRSGVAIIVTEPALQQRYEQLTSGGTILESKLHENLVEHINSEIALHTINNVAEAQTWLKSSFLYIRILQNPRHYMKAFGETSATDSSPSEILDSFAKRALANLEETGLVSLGVEGEEEGKVAATDLGDVMSRTFIKYETMRKLKNLDPQATLRQVLETLCDADEFDEIRLRAGEKAAYKKLGQSEEIRFPIKKIESTRDKCFVLFQAICSGISLADFKTEGQPLFESLTIFRHSTRIAKAIVEVALMKESGNLVKNALEILRAVNSKCWERDAIIFKQIDKLGEKSIKILSQNGISTFDELAQDPARIEKLLNRHPPFGSKIMQAIRVLPNFSLSVEEISVTSDQGSSPVEVVLECTMGVTVGSMQKKTGWNPILSVSSLVTISEGRLVDFRRSNAKAFKKPVSFQVTALLTKPSETITIAVSCNEIAGVGAFAIYHPQVSPSEYPIPDIPFDSSEIKDGPEDEENDSPDQSGPKKSIAKTSGAEKDAHEPERLDNGRYRCNHNCKDKTACRHLCCREGTEKPPRSRRVEHETESAEKTATKKAFVASKLAKTRLEAQKADDLLEEDDEFPDLADLLSGNHQDRSNNYQPINNNADSSNNSAYRDDELDAIIATRSPISLREHTVGRSSKTKKLKRKLDHIEEDVDDLHPPSWKEEASDGSSLDLTLPTARSQQHHQQQQAEQPKAKLARFAYRSPPPIATRPAKISSISRKVSAPARSSAVNVNARQSPLFMSDPSSDVELVAPKPMMVPSPSVTNNDKKETSFDVDLLEDDEMDVLASGPSKNLPSPTPRSPIPSIQPAAVPQTKPSYQPKPKEIDDPIEDDDEEDEDPMDIFKSVRIVG